jgi:hypothetical protein
MDPQLHFPHLNSPTSLSPLEPPLEVHLWLDISPTQTLLELLKSLPYSDTSLSILHPSQTPNHRKVTLRFRSPDVNSLGMRTALAWHREQIQVARLRWDLRNAQRLKDGMVPVTKQVMEKMTCVHAHEDADPSPTATDIPHRLHHKRRHPHPYLSNLDPHHPQAWQQLTSTVKTSRHWLLTCPEPSTKSTKMPMKYRHPIQKGLPKGWVYEEATEVEDGGLLDPQSYQLTSPLTCARNCQLDKQCANSHLLPLGASSITMEGLTSPSRSLTDMDGPSQHASSRFT